MLFGHPYQLLLSDKKQHSKIRLGKLVTEHIIGQMVIALKVVRADTQTLKLQKEFYDRVKTE